MGREQQQSYSSEAFRLDKAKICHDYDYTAANLLNISGLIRLKLDEIYHSHKAVYLAFYARGFQLYRLKNSNYGLICSIRAKHYDRELFYSTKSYDDSIYEKLEFAWVNLGTLNNKISVLSKISDFREVQNNVCSKKISILPEFIKSSDNINKE